MTRAAGALIWDGTRVLTIKRYKDGALGLPCGKVEMGESNRDAAIREVLEETGYKVSIPEFQCPYMDHDGNTPVYVFQVETYTHSDTFEGVEGEVLWADPEDLVQDSRFGEFNRKVLQWYKVL